MERKFKESKLAVPVAVVVAALGMTACGQNNELPKEPEFTSRGYEQEVDAGTYRIECDGTELVKKLDVGWHVDKFSYRYPDHPACNDQRLNEADKGRFNVDPFVNEYTYEGAEQTPQTPDR